MLKIDGLNKSYGAQTLFDGVSFAVNTGERVGLVGRNGHGKSTLFRIILGQEEKDEGVISVPRRYKIGNLSQHITFSEDTVLQEACSALPKHEDGIDETYKAERILHGLGITDEFFGLAPAQLSGGYQVRLNLAKCFLSEPDLLLLDEPTNYLDIVSLRWLKGFLRSWKGELMLITHDRGFMDAVCTHTIAIHRQKVKKIAGGTEKLYEQIELEEDIHEQTRQNEAKIRKEAESFINRFKSKASKASAVQSRIKALEKRGTFEELRRIRTLDFEFTRAPFPGKQILNVDNISFAYPGGDTLIDRLSLSVGKKDRIAVIGKNGKGKTTLLNLIAGELSPSSGSVSSSEGMSLACFGQTNIERLSFKNTVEEEILGANHELNRGGARKICGAMLFSGDDALKKIDVLSGGEKSRVMLGKILATPANILLLDEPTNHLDMHSVDALIEAIEAFEGALIIVTHSETIIHRVATRLIIFDNGKASFFDGTYADFLEKGGWSGEEPEISDAPAKKKGLSPLKEKSGLNKKEMRRLRAEQMTSRQKVLGPLKKRIASIEEEIVTLEASSEELSRNLLAASERNAASEIASVSKSYHESKERIERLFDELSSLTGEHEAKTKEFEALNEGVEPFQEA
ncbi:MAG: ATP-binding cassette domain-containing protein [Deltaproteobacteria bacterium]|nr:ATP-binding cassette domain-containing protein [Deltaproteobacteria bacterium]